MKCFLLIALVISICCILSCPCAKWDHPYSWGGSAGQPGGSGGKNVGSTSGGERSTTNILWEKSDVSIEKYTDEKIKFEPEENITVILRVTDMDPDHPLKDFYIEDKVPKYFYKIGNVTSDPPVKDIHSSFENESRVLKISCRYLPSIADLKYVIRTNSSGKDFCLGPASLKATRNINGRVVKVQLPSDIFYISIDNNPPEFLNWEVPKSRLYQGDNNLFAQATVIDRERDLIRCDLTSSISGPIPVTRMENNNSTYIWDLSQCPRGNHELIFTATDNKDFTSIRATVEIWESLGFLPFPTEFTWFAVIALFGGIIGCAMCRIFCRLFNKFLNKLNNYGFFKKLPESEKNNGYDVLGLRRTISYVYRPRMHTRFRKLQNATNKKKFYNKGRLEFKNKT